MTVPENARSLAREEHGAVLVLVTFWLPVLILFAMFVIDVGNWFEHKRHLQMQADAAALAGAGWFRSPCTTDTQITTTTRDYVGPHNGWTTSSSLIADNAQVGGTPPTKVHFELNSPTWYRNGSDSSPTDTTVVTGTPCTARMVDVKLTETDLPWYFNVPGFLLSGKVNYIDAHARVEVKALQRLSGALPVGVPDVRPKKGEVRFIDEATGAVIASTPITSKGPSGSLTIWDNSEAPLTVPINASRIGVRVALSGSNSTTCGDPLVECYDAGSANGLLFMRGYPTSGRSANDNPPVAQDVQLTPGTCGDPYFSGGTSTCSVGIQANISIGTIDPANYQITAFGGRCPNSGCALSYSGGSWQGTIGTDPQVGGVPIELRWQQIGGSITGLGTCSLTFKNANPCKGSFGVVQRTYRAFEDFSGPIELAQIWQGASFWVGSAPGGSSPSLVVKIGVAGALQPATSVSTPLVALKLAGGSRTQAVNCDPDIPNLRQELANGCKPTYQINTGQACPANKTALWAGWPSQPTPWNCVVIETGGDIGQVAQGMSDRILGADTSCADPAHQNHWSDFPVFAADDPRIVPVFLTPYGSFSGSGGGVVPVINFGTFYVTGWHGDPCAGDDPVPANGYIVGRFIQHIYSINNGGGGDDFCTYDTFGSCVAILTD